MDQCSDSLEHRGPLKVISNPIKGRWLLPACQNRYMCIHKASLMQTMCPPSAIFLPLLFTRMRLHMWDSLRHIQYIHTSFPLYCTDINNFFIHVSLITCMWSRLWHLCFLGKIHIYKAFPSCHKHAPVQQGHGVVLLRWRGLSFPVSQLVVKRLAFSLYHNNPISQGSSLWLCFLSTIFECIII